LTAVAAIEKHYAELDFEIRDRLRNGRLGQVYQSRRLTDALQLGDRLKHFQVPETRQVFKVFHRKMPLTSQSNIAITYDRVRGLD